MPEQFARDQIKTLDAWQIEAMTFDGKRLLLNCHRQAGKSTIASISASYVAVYQPGSLILLVSPSLRQSTELFRKVIAGLYNLDPLPKMIEETKLACELANGSRIVCLPGTEQTVRGFSAPTLIIEDEASRVSDELHFALLPMLATNDGAIILMSTPNGKRGHFWNEWNEGDKWKKIIYPANENSRISTDYLAEMKNTMGELWFRQEFMCEFVENVEQVFGYDLVARAWRDDVEPLFRPATVGGIEPLYKNQSNIAPLFGGGA